MPQELQVTWQKNAQTNEWFDFLRLDLSTSYFIDKKGVYVIWLVSGQKNPVIKVGSGNLAENFKNLRANPLVIEYSNGGQLKVSWIAVNGVLKEEQMAGVEAFLCRVYSPILVDKKQDKVEEIGVNKIGK